MALSLEPTELRQFVVASQNRASWNASRTSYARCRRCATRCAAARSGWPAPGHGATRRRTCRPISRCPATCTAPSIAEPSDPGEFVAALSKQPAQPAPENVDAVKQEVARRWGVVSLLDVLKEADWLTGLHTEFTSAATREQLAPDEQRKRLLLVRLALGTRAVRRSLDRVLEEPDWADRLTDHDRRALTHSSGRTAHLIWTLLALGDMRTGFRPLGAAVPVR